MRTFIFDADKVKLITDRLNIIKQTLTASCAEELTEKNQYIDAITAKIALFQNQTFTFSDAIFLHNPIAVYKKILLQQKFENTEDKTNKGIARSKLLNVSYYRMTLLRNDLSNYALEKVVRFSISQEQVALTSTVVEEKNLFQIIFSEMQKNKMTQLREINDGLLESLLEIAVLEMIRYRIDVILFLEKIKGTMEYNNVVENLISNIENCDGKFSTMRRLIALLTKDRPGLFFNWRPEIGYGELYNHLKFLQEAIGSGASVNTEVVLPKNAFSTRECGCI